MNHCAILPCIALFSIALCGCPAVNPTDYAPEPQGEHILRFVQITDIHITDEESPARMIRFDGMVSEAWRPQEAYAAQVLDATCREINRVHYRGLLTQNRPVDFVIFTGDLCDNAQMNELRWFTGVVDGRVVTPDSGDRDAANRPVPPEDNPNLPFKAEGLAKDIPWFAAIGNHDDLALGNFTIDRSSAEPELWRARVGPGLATLVGFNDLNPPQTAFRPTGEVTLSILCAGDPEPILPGTYQLDVPSLVSGNVPADPARQYLSRTHFIQELYDNTRSLPAGHGFDPSAALFGHAFYSFRPRRDVPVRVIVLDSVGPDSMPGYIGADGAITRRQFDGFLKPEMQAAIDSEESVIVVTHHPSEYLKRPTSLPTIRASEFTSYLAQQPNVIAHICGHVHYEDVIMHDGPHPYPEIITGSLLDYPQRARMLDVYYDPETREFHIQSTFISHADHPTHLSEDSFIRATADMFFDPESPEWAERVTNLDLSDLESILTSGTRPR